MKEYEASARTVEEAIEEGLEALGVAIFGSIDAASFFAYAFVVRRAGISTKS